MEGLMELVTSLRGVLEGSPFRQEGLQVFCDGILEGFHFDCVFLAQGVGPESSLEALAIRGKEEVYETCLYRLGTEEKTAISKLPFKVYPDMTGKPVFNKAGSLRIQKPSSGVFFSIHRPKERFILLGCAHQNSKAYDPKEIEELSALWTDCGALLESALGRMGSGSGPAPTPAPGSVSPVPATSVRASDPTPGEGTGEGRRPVILVDEETRLFNHEFFTECLSIEVERAKRYSRPLSLMFLSVTPNPAFLAAQDGRRVAHQVAEILAKSLRRVDFICRLEREKYGIILPDTAQNTYGIIAKRIFKHFKQVMGDQPSVHLNISASTYPQHAGDHLALLEQVEKLLSQAKEVGPNKAVLPD